MLQAFVGLITELFPSVDPTTATRCLREIADQDIDPARLFLPRPFDHLAQGDIIHPVSFFVGEDDEVTYRYDGPGVVISNTCDAEHDEHVLLAASFPLRVYLENNPTDETTLRSNCIFNLMFLPWVGADGRGIVTDLSWVQTHSRASIISTLRSGAIRKVASLSNIGFYLLLAKLTVHLLRPETEEVLAGRGVPEPRGR